MSAHGYDKRIESLWILIPVLLFLYVVIPVSVILLILFLLGVF